MLLNISYRFLFAATLAALLFVLFPRIDLTLAALFYDGHTFYLKDLPVVRFVYRVAPLVAIVFGAAMLFVYLYLLASGKKTLGRWGRRHYLYLVVVLILGPGLVVNGLLKEEVGRARPAQVTQFGGVKTFTPAFVISDQCQTNCSFVCGHASAGYYFVALALLLRGRARQTVFWGAVVFGTLIGIVRMMQGGHFASDVVFSFVAVYLTAKVVYSLMFERRHR